MATATNRIFSQYLGAGTNLDDVMTPGYYDVENPPGLPLGTYSILVLRGGNNIPSNVRTKQIAYNLSASSIQERSKVGSGAWSAFASVSGGGGASPAVFDVRDYGGVGDNNPASGATNRAAFEAAILAANAVGGGIIYAPRGTYFINYGGSASVGGIQLRDNMTLAGDGMGITIIKAADIGNNDMAGLVRTQSGIENENILVRDLTIDANKQGQTGWANIICFFAGVTPDNRVLMDRDVWCVNVECRNGKDGTAGSSNLSRGYGFDPHEVVDRFVAINCIAHDNERDGFVLDGVLNFQLTSCKSWNNGRHGFNFITESFNGDVVNCHAWDNATLGTGNNFTAQSDSHHIKFVGCRSRGGAENGFRLRRGINITDTHFQILDCVIETAGKNGIQATGGKYNTIADNTFINNGQSINNTYFDVSLDEDNGDTGPFTGESYCVVRNNDATTYSSNGTKAAYRENAAASAPPNNNVFAWNEARGHQQGKYLEITGVGSVIRDRGYMDDYYAADHGVLASNSDNGPALRALASRVAAAGGGEIVLPPGTINVAGTGTASQGCVALAANVSLRGQGMGVTILRALDPINNSITGVVRTLSGGTNVGNAVRDLTITTEAVTGTGDVTLLYLGGAQDTNPIIENVEVIGADNGAGNAGYGARFTSSVDGARVVNLRCVNNQRDGLYINGATNSQFDDIYAFGSGRHNILVSSSSVNCTITNQENANAAVNGVQISGDSIDIRLLGGRVSNAAQEGIRVMRDTGSTIPEMHTMIRDMLIQNSGRNGLRVSSAHHVSIIGNTFKNNGTSANNTYADINLGIDTAFAGTKTLFASILSNVFFVPASGNRVGWNIREIDNEASDSVLRDNIFRGAAVTASVAIATGSNTLTHTFPATSGTLALTSDISANTGPRFGRGNISMMNVRNIGGTTVDLHGITLTAGTGANIATTATSRSFTAGSVVGSLRRLGYVGSATAGNMALLGPNSSNYVTRGSAARTGGFKVSYLVAAVVNPSGGRAFFGLSTLSGNTANANAVVNTAVDANVNILGVGYDSADSNFSIFHNDGAGTATKIDLGASFSIAANRLLEVTFECGQNASTISYTVREPSTNTTASGTISTDLPANTVMLAPQFSMNNNATAVACEFDLVSLFMETLSV